MRWIYDSDGIEYRVCWSWGSPDPARRRASARIELWARDYGDPKGADVVDGSETVEAMARLLEIHRDAGRFDLSTYDCLAESLAEL